MTMRKMSRSKLEDRKRRKNHKLRRDNEKLVEKINEEYEKSKQGEINGHNNS